MPAQPETANVSVGQFAEKIRREMIPLRKPFSYYFADLPLTEEDIREYLEEPIAALPPSVLSQLPKVSILLVPYLERGREKGAGRGELVRMNPPSEDNVSWTSCVLGKEEAVLAFALKDQEVADYHYHFYHLLAALVAEQWSDEVREEYTALIRAELETAVYGEVDEASWNLKQSLLQRNGKGPRKETKAFRDYVRQSLIDTMTLYLHGICCDIDVETGPRQIPSRCLRRRLQLLEKLYPPPTGYNVFPEESRRTHRRIRSGD
jgi:hypothetical protein